VEDFFRQYEERPTLQSVVVGGVELEKGSRVLLWPRAGGDIIDLALKGKVAFVEGIEQDYEDRIYIAVTLEEDPGRDLGEDRFLGHRFFFSPEEVEPLDFEVPHE
jgi:hydrogenase maturation protease